MAQDYNSHESTEKIAWDLRQAWAKQVEYYETKITRIDIPSRNYPEWLRDLEMFYDLVFPRVKKKRKKRIAKYELLLRTAIKYARSNQKSFIGKDHDAKAVYEIESSLRKIHRFIRRVLEDEGMYGTTEDEQGL